MDKIELLNRIKRFISNGKCITKLKMQQAENTQS